VKSLYNDEALPRGPLIQWLLQQLLGAKFSHIDIKNCLDSAPGVHTEPTSAKKFNFCAVLEEPPPGFKGFVSEEDVRETLGQDLWDEASLCLSRGGWPKTDDVSHKYYVVASWLQDVSPKLGCLSFGRLLSIVKCSAQANGTGVLGHRNGLLVPYAESEDCERRVNACTGQPTAVAPDEQYVKTWGELKDCLRRHLRQQPTLCIEVSKVKSMFRTVFHRELSETVFGYQNLTKLLNDPNMGEEFLLETLPGQRYILRLVSADKTFAAAVPQGQQLQQRPQQLQ